MQASGSQYGPEQAGLGSGNGFLGLLGDYVLSWAEVAACL